MINQKEIKNLADLARLKLSEAEAVKMNQDEAQILNYVDQLREINLENISLENVYQPRDLRPDKAIPFSGSGKLISAFPQKQGRFLKVPFVFDHQDGSH